MKITFVCSGNTCRSPMAEMMMKELLTEEGIEGVEVQSRGVVANVGAPLNELAEKALNDLEIPVTPHEGTAITIEDIQESDFVIVMTERHKMRLGNLPKVFTLNQMTKCGEIDDPFGQDEEAFKKCASQLMNALPKLIPMIKRHLAYEKKN